ncbi:hypothetical protein [Microlunatus sp. Gsoil 973]|uniref:hypothetical protein n=1 Tax=Microlunatus sp. Gsoil 973 TaxID=2672569 RepID=UPI0012B48B6B|nr:hypothetical protein [Microlunatus sp. Gsoil 973]QGN34500.1 hypothetical protein GJV80_18635 [Microlunatus sp. Gsoil 973]
MTSYPTSPNFLKHAANLNAVIAALTQVERAHKRAIRDHDEPSEMAFRKVHTLLLGVYAEARLRKIIDDPTGFNDRERRLIWSNRSQEQRWVTAVELAARRHYQVLTHEELANVLPPLALGRIEAVSDLLVGELSAIITDRNRLAHGQWVWQLRSSSDDQFSSTPHDYDYNYEALRARRSLLDKIGELVNLLCVSEPTFDREFNTLTRNIEDARSKLDGMTYPELAAQLRRSRQRPSGRGGRANGQK